jgi:hypothetical protein
MVQGSVSGLHPDHAATGYREDIAGGLTKWAVSVREAGLCLGWALLLVRVGLGAEDDANLCDQGLYAVVLHWSWGGAGL